MKKRKILFRLSALAIMLIPLLFANAVVSAADIVIIRNPNPGGVHVLSLEEINYHIETSNDENSLGYLVCNTNGVDETIGTCTVIVIEEQTPNGYILCNDEISNSCGTLTITITNALTGEGYVSDVSGDLEYIFIINTYIKLQ